MLIFLNVFIIFCMFVMGSLFGSFFSLATYRLPRHQDIVATRSYCTTCKHRLNFFDLIPVISYIIRGGRCKYCSSRISPRYLILEISNGLVFVIFYLIFGYTLKLALVCLVYAVIFTVIGSLIMKSKMTEEEKKEIDLKSKKKGVFLSELVIALIMFTLFLVSSYIMSSNYQNKALISISKSNAIALAVKNLELSKATKYEDLNSYTTEVTENNIKYKINTVVSSYSDTQIDKKDIVKKIDVVVDYMVDGEYYTFKLSTLKGKV